jgi:hypothetical protein
MRKSGCTARNGFGTSPASRRIDAVQLQVDERRADEAAT